MIKPTHAKPSELQEIAHREVSGATSFRAVFKECGDVMRSCARSQDNCGAGFKLHVLYDMRFNPFPLFRKLPPIINITLESHVRVGEVSKKVRGLHDGAKALLSCGQIIHGNSESQLSWQRLWLGGLPTVSHDGSIKWPWTAQEAVLMYKWTAEPFVVALSKSERLHRVTAPHQPGQTAQQEFAAWSVGTYVESCSRLLKPFFPRILGMSRALESLILCKRPEAVRNFQAVCH